MRALDEWSHPNGRATWRLVVTVMLALATVVVATAVDSVEVGAQDEAPTTVPATHLDPTPEKVDSDGCSPLPTLPGGKVTDDLPATAVQREVASGRLVRGTQREKASPSSDNQVVVESDGDLQAASAEVEGITQVVASTRDVGRELRITFRIESLCGSPAVATVAKDGQSGSVSSKSSSEAALIAAPWAIDGSGALLPTHYEASGGQLVQVIDTRAAVAPVLLDPTYSAMNCAGHWNDLSAYWYLNINNNDYAYCAVNGMLQAAKGYLPQFAYEANVANDYGLVAVNVNGGCSWSPDTGPYFDFQLPCKAHDYCYDLRAAAFANTVSDGDCDVMFFWLMEAHCNNRVFAYDCRVVRDTYYAFVSLPNVVTDPNPGIVNIRNRADDQCVDVQGPSTADFAPLQQWGCVGVSNQKFRIFPGSTAGLFEVKIPFSGLKCAAALFNVAQRTCSGVDAQFRQFRIQGALNQNLFSLRPQFNFGSCWRVPFTTAYGQDLENAACDDSNLWYIWRINAIS